MKKVIQTLGRACQLWEGFGKLAGCQGRSTVLLVLGYACPGASASARYDDDDDDDADDDDADDDDDDDVMMMMRTMDDDRMTIE